LLKASHKVAELLYKQGGAEGAEQKPESDDKKSDNGPIDADIS
jgi:hypothetical protein